MSVARSKDIPHIPRPETAMIRPRRIGHTTFETKDLDRQIVRLLTEDGRRSYTDLAKETGLSVSAVHQRVRRLEKRGVVFQSKPHLIAKMDDHDLWMAFFADPDGHTLALMQEAPKGYAPAA